MMTTKRKEKKRVTSKDQGFVGKMKKTVPSTQQGYENSCALNAQATMKRLSEEEGGGGADEASEAGTSEGSSGVAVAALRRSGGRARASA